MCSLQKAISVYLQSVETAGRGFLISLWGVQGGLPKALMQIWTGTELTGLYELRLVYRREDLSIKWEDEEPASLSLWLVP